MRTQHVHPEPPRRDERTLAAHPPHRYPAVSGPERPQDTPLPPRHTVLIIDDDADVLRRTHEVLRLRYRLLGTTQPQAALNLLNQQPVHLVLVDQRLPGMTGTELLGRIHAEHPDMVCLLLVDSADVKAALEAINRGHAYRYISKPWDPEDLQTVLRQAAEHHDLLSRSQQLAQQLGATTEELRNANAEMVQTYDLTLEGWSRALELCDQDTDGHSRRVTEMAVRLARAMGMTEAQLVQVRRGALLHDIGKVGIPDSILVKPGPLSEEEWAIMKRHASYGYELLAPIGFLREALDIPYCHHEKWDGTGYPRGLKGKEIPLAARIFAVIDVWDALCSNRPYRKAWPESKAREYIRTLAGAHFDPKVVETFLRVLV